MGIMATSFRNAWNTFTNSRDPTLDKRFIDLPYADQFSSTQSSPRSYYRMDQSLIPSIYTRMAIDVSSVEIYHAKVSDEGEFLEVLNKSSLHHCLTRSANADQIGRVLIRDAVLTLFDEGVAAIVATDVTEDPELTDSYEVLTLRVGRVVQWHPYHVVVNLYNERTGRRQDVLVDKANVAIIENPFYPIMNDSGSIIKRLNSVLTLLDMTDKKNNSGKLDLIIQLPYAIKTEARRRQAAKRKEDMESQLESSKYGIAYTEATEKVIQLNRPVENTLFTQAKYYTSMLFSQLGLSENVFNGTADEQEMLNYYNRTIEPILTVLTEGMTRTFISKTGYTQGQRVVFVQNPFKLTSVLNLAEVADKFTRNAILSSNEIRSIVGYKPVQDPVADKLLNKNLNHPPDQTKMVEKEIQEDSTEDEASI